MERNKEWRLFTSKKKKKKKKYITLQGQRRDLSGQEASLI